MAGTGAFQAQKRLDTIANNLANMNTPGFKSDQLVFESYLNKHVSGAPKVSTPQKPMPGYMRQSEYVVTSQQYTDFTQGPIRTTGNPLDVALNGDGFLAVATNNGERYTRNGSLQVGPNGELVTGEGHVVLDDTDSPIYVNDGAITIDDTGNIWVGDPSLGSDTESSAYYDGAFGVHVGRLKIVDFPRPYKLEKEGNGLLRAYDPGEIYTPTNVEVIQKHLESSNVNMINQVTDMIEIQRMTETYQKAIRESDSMTSRLLQQVGRPA